MAIWVIRAGRHGEYEQKFIQDNRVYVTWDGLAVDLGKLHERAELQSAMAKIYPDAKANGIRNWVSQVWPFAHEIAKGDIVILPLKTQPAIQIGEMVGEYQFSPDGPNPFYHWRAVKWIGEAVPRSHFGQDLLYSFGAFMTICRIKRNNAEKRIIAMRASGWKPETDAAVIREAGVAYANDAEEVIGGADIEELAGDQIAALIGARFKGHGLARLVEAILKAQGYTTYRSPEGADGGVDILAGSGALGFGAPRMCVEVKSEDTPIDRPTVDKLLGAVSKFSAQEGLFVSWNGFRSNVHKELAQSFFRLRLWTQKDVRSSYSQTMTS